VAVRTDRWTYVYRFGGADELYDRGRDERELTNLARSTQHSGTVRRLRDQLLAWLVDTSDVIPPDEDPRFPRIPHGTRSV
jgi:hypothetical protein